MKGRIALTVGLAIVLALLVLAGLSGQAGRAQATCDRYVLGSDGVDNTDCSDEAHPCKTIQYAIDQADPGDVICVAYNSLAGPPRIYPETLVIRESITLDGAWQASCMGIPAICNFYSIPCDPTNVRIDAGGAGRVISISGSIAPTIDCFTIKGGDADGLGGDPDGFNVGGGIYSRDAAPIIINSVISGNIGCDTCSASPAALGYGGGIYLLNAPATTVISNNLIAHNVGNNDALGQGGGIMLRDSDAQVLSNTIEYNRAGWSAGYGGGIMVKDGDPTIADNAILSNRAGQGVRGVGGGIMVWSDETATIERNVIEANYAIYGTGDGGLISGGGGIYCVGDPTIVAVIRDNTLGYNIASPFTGQTGHGGGMYLSDLAAPSLVSGNTLVWNIAGHNDDGKGGGIYVDDSVVSITDNDFINNSATWVGSHGEGGGLFINGGTALVQSNVITGNNAAGFLGHEASSDGYGGGVAAVEGDTVVQGNRIEYNWGTRSHGAGIGGGIFASGGNPEILNNSIIGNYATAYDTGFGGGVAISGSLAYVMNNRIQGNIASVDTDYTTGGTWGFAGGLYGLRANIAALNNDIIGNVGADVNQGYGGGIYVEGGILWLDSNTITDNNASSGSNSYGGAARCTISAVCNLTNNIIARNQANTEGSGVAMLSSSGTLAHNTIVGNFDSDGAGVRVQSSSHITLYNNIIATQTVGILNAGYPGSTVSATHTLFENNGSNYGIGVTSVSEIAGPAMLRSDYRLHPSSNARDQAPTLSGVVWDIDRDPRPVGTASDIGADEYALKAYLPLAFRNY